jgi:hypothetical protein
MATVSLSDSECIISLGCSKQEACDRFTEGVRVALMRIDILRNYDLVVLQALVLYMVRNTSVRTHWLDRR